MDKGPLVERPGLGALLLGGAILVFGLTIGGVGLATAGVGIGIPMIPLGLHLVLRGGRGLVLDLKKKPGDKPPPVFELSRLGGITLGVVLLPVGIALTPAAFVGLPVLIAGLALIFLNVFLRTKLAAAFTKMGLLRD